MSKDGLKITGLVGLIAAGLGFIWGVKGPGGALSQGPSQSQKAAESSAQASVPNGVKSSDSKKVSANQKARSAKKSQASQVGLKSANLNQFSGLHQTLDQFKSFQARPLLSANDRASRAALFSRANLEDAKNFLLSPEKGKIDHEVSLHHQAVVDFLKTAHEVKPQEVRQVILTLATNGSLSDKAIPKSARHLMAKDKAELLFHTMATDKTLSAAVKSSNLDGPTKKVLSNISKQYALNLAESSVEAQKFRKGKW